MITQNLIPLLSMAALALMAGDEIDKGRIVRGLIILISLVGVIYGFN